LEDRKINKARFEYMFNNFGYEGEVGDKMVVRELVLVLRTIGPFLEKRGYG